MTTTATALFEQAERELEGGDYKAARHAYRDVLLALLPEGSAISVLAIVAMERLAEISVLFGDSAAAVTLLEQIVKAFQDAGNDYAADSARLKLASVYMSSGQQRVAVELIADLSGRPPDGWEAETFPFWEASWHWPATTASDYSLFFSRYYLEAGRVAAWEGQYEQASEVLKRGLVHSTTGDTAGLATVPLTLALAAAKLEQGDLSSAEAALGLLGELTAPRQCGYFIRRLEIEAKLHLLRGNFGPAKSGYERALAMCRASGFARAAAEASLNLAHVLIFLNQTRAAAELCAQTREQALLRNEGELAARCELLIGFAGARGQSLAFGVSIAPSVTELWREPAEELVTQDATTLRNPFDLPAPASFLVLFEERALGFHWRLGRSDWEASRRYLEEVELVFTGSEPATDSLLIRARLVTLDCMLAFYEQRIDKARIGFEEIAPMLLKMGLRPEHWQALRFLAWCYARLGRTLDCEKTERESAQLLFSMTETLTDEDRAMYRLNKWTADEEYIAAEMNELARIKMRLSSRTWRDLLLRPWLRYRLLCRLAGLLDHVDRYKGTVLQRAIGTKAPPAKNGKAWLRRLLTWPRNRATLAFVVLPDRMLVARIGLLSLDFGISAVTRIQIREWVRLWHESVRDLNPSVGRAAMRVLAEAMQLTTLLEQLPHRVTTLTFIPDDSLHGLPFSALRWKGRSVSASDASGPGKYLIEDFAVSVGFEWSPPGWPPARKRAALSVAVSEGNLEFPELVEAESEMKAVAAWLASRGVPGIPLSEVSKQALLRQLPEAGFFHVACHGVFEPDCPDRSGLVFVATDKTVELLSIRDLSSLDLRGLKQVILSSCWSADNFVLPGRWIISLPETLWRAGTESVLGNLWRVDDKLASGFVVQFCKNLESMPRDEAVRQVQLACLHNELLNGPTRDLSDPFYWAGAVLYGRCDSIRF